MGAHRISAVLLLCTAGALTSSIFYTTVPSNSDCGDLIINLPTGRHIDYRKNYANSDLEANRFGLTKNGSLFLQNPLWDLQDRRIRLSVISRNQITGKRSQQNVLLKIVQDSHTKPTNRVARSANRKRSKRAAEVSISKTVSEAVSNEIVLDYATVGVITDSNNRFYMQPDDSLPFAGVDRLSGRLIIQSNRKLDYETAPNKQYQPIVFINNTANGNGKKSRHIKVVGGAPCCLFYQREINRIGFVLSDYIITFIQCH